MYSDRIAYTRGYKYQLREDAIVQTVILPAETILTRYITLDINGLLTVQNGYSWDGPSGPTFDTRTFLRGSLFHDALYQLIRQGHLTINPNRKLADELLHTVCLRDGMNRLRAWYVYRAVRRLGKSAALPSSQKPVLYAP